MNVLWNMREFIVMEMCDPAKQGSVVKIGKVLKGSLDASGRRIYFEDANEIEWVFFVGDTCELMGDFIQRFNRYLVKLGYPEAISVNVFDTGIEAVITRVPITEHFSNSHKINKGRYFVRLSSADYFNQAVTQGQF